MSSELNLFLGLAFIALLVFELVGAAFWLPVYYRFGLPGFRREIRVRDGGPDALAVEWLQFVADRQDLRVTFRQVAPGLVAFRYKRPPFRSMEFTPVEILHGSLRHDPASSTIRLTGFLSLTLLAVSAVIIISVADLSALLVIGILVFTLRGFLKQLKTYERVAKAVVEIWPPVPQDTGPA